MSQAIWMADVSATAAAPRLVATIPSTFNAVVSPMVRPDGGAVAYAWWTSFTQDATVYEASKTPAAPVTVTPGLWGGYDVSGDHFIVERFTLTPSFDTLLEFRTLTRGALGSPSTKLGTPGMESMYFSNLLYESHGAVVLSESDMDDAATEIRPVLVNLAAPDKPLPLTAAPFAPIHEDGPDFYLVN
jgi:hypothetical protein